MMGRDFCDGIVQNASPSIAMLIMRDIMKKQLADSEKHEFESLALQGKTIKTVLSWQMPDGYFGTRLHTPPSNSKVWSHEGCVRYLLEMGFSTKYQPLKKALDVMISDNWEKEFSNSKAGQVLGCEIIRASLFAQAGLHDYDFVHRYVKNALISFEYVANAKGYFDIAVPYKDKHIYQNGKRLPVVYDFWILAYTHEWRTKSNYEILSKAYENLYQWLPLPPTYIKAGSQLVAPFGHVQRAYNDDFNENIGFSWLNFYELTARMGMLTGSSPFHLRFQRLFNKVVETKGDIFKNIDKKGFVNWSSYSGLALEDDWSKKQRKINDLTFRCFLINSFASYSV